MAQPQQPPPPPPRPPQRFFNERLRNTVYVRCALPTLEPRVAAPNVIPPSGYASVLEHAEGETEFQHTRHVPRRTPANPGLSRIFHGMPALTSLPQPDGWEPPPPPPPPDAPTDAEEGAADASAFLPGDDDDACFCGGGSPVGANKKRKRAAPKKPWTNGQKRAGDFLFRSYKLRLHPTPAQRAELTRTFGIMASIYNWANAMVRTGRATPNFEDLRMAFNAQQHGAALDNHGPPQRVYVGSRCDDNAVPTMVRAYAFKELALAYTCNPGHPPGDRRMDLSDGKPTATITLEKYSHATSGLVRFESARPAQQYRLDVVDGSWMPKPRRRPRGRGEHALTECDMFLSGGFSDLGPIIVQDKARLINALVAEGRQPKENAKILWDKRTDAYYLIYLRALPKPVDPDPGFLNKRIVATDPGCRPFQSWYSPTTGCHGTVLAGLEDKIKARRRALDVMKRRVMRRKREDKLPDAPTSRERRKRLETALQRASARAQTTRSMSKKLTRERIRFNNWIAAAHYDAAHFLLRDHDLIIQPKLSVRQLIDKTDVEAIRQRYLDLSHYAFRKRLISAAALCEGRHVLESIEPGTSKTCTHCGYFHHGLAVTDKIYQCPHCHLCVDRQLAGARNNFFAAYGIAAGVGWDGVEVGGGRG